MATKKTTHISRRPLAEIKVGAGARGAVGKCGKAATTGRGLRYVGPILRTL